MSVESESILTIIETSAAGPSEVTGDAGSVKQQPLSDLIAAHKYISTNDIVPTTGGGRAARGLRFSKMTPGGTI